MTDDTVDVEDTFEVIESENQFDDVTKTVALCDEYEVLIDTTIFNGKITISDTMDLDDDGAVMNSQLRVHKAD